MSKRGHLLTLLVPALFVLGLPAALIGWYASHPATSAEVSAHRWNEQVQRKIRRCSIGLDHDTCARAFYCASDPQQCARLMAAEPADRDDTAAY
jgi:hypothetical protein